MATAILESAELIRKKSPVLPFLESGDHLTREEFERRYNAMPNLKKAELIEGVVYVGSPVRIEYHGEQHGHLTGWIFTYDAFTPGLIHGPNSTVRFDDDNDFQPDDLLMIKPGLGGQAQIVDGYIEGGPEFAAEVSASTASMDLHKKMIVYLRNRVREYLVWRVFDEQIDWFVLREDNYDRLEPDAEGIYRSQIFPGLWLDSKAMLRGDLRTVLETLHKGLASPEHKAFVERLQTAAPGA